MPERIDESHGLYRIIVGTHKKSVKGIAYVGPRPVHVAGGEEPEEILAGLKQIISREQQQRRDARVEGVPTAEEYRDALLALGLSRAAGINVLLRCHLGMTAASIKALADVTRREPSDVLADYAALGRSIGRLLGFAPPSALDRSERPIASFATPAGGGGWPERPWALRTEANEGFGAVIGVALTEA